jgi:hypothetical protein
MLFCKCIVKRYPPTVIKDYGMSFENNSPGQLEDNVYENFFGARIIHRR